MLHLKKLSPFFAFLIFAGITVLLWQNQNRHEWELVLRHTESSLEQIGTTFFFTLKDKEDW